MPATIFVTAYDQYAVAAFDANALDYLLKPFGKARFDRALGRARERLTGLPDPETLRRLLQAMGRQSVHFDSVPVAKNGRIVFIKTRDIHWIESAGNYARLHLTSSHHDIRETLTSLEAKLDSKEFVRIHRSIIVNLNYVKEVHPWFHGYHLVLLESGQELRMSRYQRDVAERLGLRGLLS
jgi:two-component system LytT family response regulator